MASKKNYAMCCKRFVLSKSYEELKQIYLNFMAKSTEGDCRDQYGFTRDIHLIFPMLIALKPKEQGEHPYSCKHLINDRCSIYDVRPYICKSFNQYRCKGFPKCKTNCFKDLKEIEKYDSVPIKDTRI